MIKMLLKTDRGLSSVLAANRLIIGGGGAVVFLIPELSDQIVSSVRLPDFVLTLAQAVA